MKFKNTEKHWKEIAAWLQIVVEKIFFKNGYCYDILFEIIGLKQRCSRQKIQGEALLTCTQYIFEGLASSIEDEKFKKDIHFHRWGQIDSQCPEIIFFVGKDKDDGYIRIISAARFMPSMLVYAISTKDKQVLAPLNQRPFIQMLYGQHRLAKYLVYSEMPTRFKAEFSYQKLTTYPPVGVAPGPVPSYGEPSSSLSPDAVQHLLPPAYGYQSDDDDFFNEANPYVVQNRQAQ